MADELHEPSVDRHGKAIPLDPIQARLRAERGLRALAEVAEIGDAEEQRATLEALLKALEEARPSNRERSA